MQSAVNNGSSRSSEYPVMTVIFPGRELELRKHPKRHCVAS